jgi:hypothetical protein
MRSLFRGDRVKRRPHSAAMLACQITYSDSRPSAPGRKPAAATGANHPSVRPYLRNSRFPHCILRMCLIGYNFILLLLVGSDVADNFGYHAAPGYDVVIEDKDHP